MVQHDYDLEDAGYFPFNYEAPIKTCSAVLLGFKVYLPCEALDMVRNDYGPNWMEPKKSWNAYQMANYRTKVRWKSKEQAKKAYNKILLL